MHVHHRNGDTSDNSPENLIAMCPTCGLMTAGPSFTGGPVYLRGGDGPIDRTWRVELYDIDFDHRISGIKILRSVLDLGLRSAKDLSDLFVKHAAPVTVRSGLTDVAAGALVAEFAAQDEHGYVSVRAVHPDYRRAAAPATYDESPITRGDTTIADDDDVSCDVPASLIADAWRALEYLRNATTIATQADAYMALSEQFADLVTFHPEYNPSTGRIEVPE
jgi:hypothetical protein